MKIEFLLIKKEDEFCKSKKSLINYLKSNEKLSIGEKRITFNKFFVNYSLKTGLIKNISRNERYFILTLEKELGGDVEEAIIKKYLQLIRVLKKMIKSSNFQFNLIVLWDDISFHFSTKAYPLIYEIENLMRKLIFKMMSISVGMNWFSEATPLDVKTAIEKKAGKNNIKDILEESLYEADFIHLSFFLFKKYSSLSNNDLIKDIDSASSTADLNLDKLKDIVPKSNWERYFSRLVSIDGLEKKWEQLYDLRNKVAHNKPISLEDYNKIKRLTNFIKGKLIQAITKVDAINIDENQKVELTEFAFEDFFNSTSLGNFFNLGFRSSLRRKFNFNTLKSPEDKLYSDLYLISLLKKFNLDENKFDIDDNNKKE